MKGYSLNWCAKPVLLWLYLFSLINCEISCKS
jgi:hypothetical protein